MTQRIGVLVFDEVEVLDACGPFEMFSVANRMAVRRGAPEPFEVVLIGATGAGPVRARGGLRLAADTALADAPECDLVLVPGGVVDEVVADEAVLSWLRGVRPRAQLIASVCNGAFVLASAGLFDHRPVTTHWEDLPGLRAGWPDLDVREEVRFIDHGDLATSAGVSAGIDMSLHVVSRLTSMQLAVATARMMDYPWDPGKAFSGQDTLEATHRCPGPMWTRAPVSGSGNRL